MDKEFIIDLLKCSNSNQFPIDKVVKLLTDYCVLEHNKSVIDTNNFINILLSNPAIISHYINTAVDYYKKKFNINELYSKEGKLLQIF